MVRDIAPAYDSISPEFKQENPLPEEMENFGKGTSQETKLIGAKGEVGGMADTAATAEALFLPYKLGVIDPNDPHAEDVASEMRKSTAEHPLDF